MGFLKNGMACFCWCRSLLLLVPAGYSPVTLPSAESAAVRLRPDPSPATGDPRRESDTPTRNPCRRPSLTPQRPHPSRRALTACHPPTRPPSPPAPKNHWPFSSPNSGQIRGPLPIAEDRGMTEPSSPLSLARADSTSAVLESEDLLPKILLRVGFPTTLVCAALVSKRWLQHASDPAFLRRFRQLHPPALLGFYAKETISSRSRFVAVSQSPELSVAVRRASAQFSCFSHCDTMDCRNGRLLVYERGRDREAVLSTLQPTCAMGVLPPPPEQRRNRGLYKTFLCSNDIKTDSSDMKTDSSEDEGNDDSTGARGLHQAFLCINDIKTDSNDDNDSNSTEEEGTGAITVWMLGPFGTGTELQVDLLTPLSLVLRSKRKRSGAWGVHRSEVILLPEKLTLPQIVDILPPFQNKVYCLTHSQHVLRLDLTAGTASFLKLPDRVVTDNFILRLTDKFMISSGEDGSSSGEDEEDRSRLSLVYVDGYQLSIWQLPTTTSDAGDWQLVYDKIHVREACSRLDDVRVTAVDNSLQFVFLCLQSSALLMHMHLPSRSEKVYNELNLRYWYELQVHPFMMVWPPIFPALKKEDNLEK